MFREDAGAKDILLPSRLLPRQALKRAATMAGPTPANPNKACAERKEAAKSGLAFSLAVPFHSLCPALSPLTPHPGLLSPHHRPTPPQHCTFQFRQSKNSTKIQSKFAIARLAVSRRHRPITKGANAGRQAGGRAAW